jgi:hypothetical protein
MRLPRSCIQSNLAVEMKKQHSIRLIITTLIVPGRSFALLFMALFACTLNAQQATLMRLTASGNSMQNETVVYFDSAATYNYDPQFDAPSLGVNDGYLNIVTRLSNIDYQVDAVPDLLQNVSIPVKITTGTSGTYSVYATDINNLPQGAYVRLRDSYNNTDFDLRSGTAQYYISDTETVARFVLLISVNVVHNVSLTNLNPTCSASGNGSIQAMATGAGPFNFYWKDSLNNIIRIATHKNADTLAAINAGTYRVDVTSPGTNNNATVYAHLSGSMSAKADFYFPSSVNLTNGVANVHFTNTSLNAQAFTWDFGDGMGSSLNNPNHYYNQVGTYTVTLSATNSTCPEISVRRQVLTINATMSIDEPAPPALALGADAEGYFVTPPAAGIVSVTDLLGQQLTNEMNAAAGQKIYLSHALPTNQILIVQFIGIGTQNSIKIIKQP